MAAEISPPDFDQLANLFIEEGAVSFSPSELHGALVGHLAAGQRQGLTELIAFCADQLNLTEFVNPRSQDVLQALYQSALAQLESPEFELALLLPDDEHSLQSRAEQLGFWVSGFLAGFGLGASSRAEHLSSEAQESLKDLVQIAQIEADADSEEEEGLLVEVEEYVRMAGMLLFAECNKPDAPSNTEQTLH